MATSGEFGSLRHLAGRFFGALLPFGPPEPDERWAQDHLLAEERTLWQRMSGADRRHAVGVARRTVDELTDADPPSEPVDRAVVAAALLHDVGKVEAALGTWARAGVTFAGMAVGRDRIVTWSGARGPGRPAGCWGDRRGWRNRLGADSRSLASLAPAHRPVSPSRRGRSRSALERRQRHADRCLGRRASPSAGTLERGRPPRLSPQAGRRRLTAPPQQGARHRAGLLVRGAEWSLL